MEEDQDWTTADLAEAAYAAGQAVAQLGRFDVLVANVAIGFRDQELATTDPGAVSPAYTGTSQITPVPAVAVEANLPAAQERRRRETVAHYRQLLVCLDALRPAVEDLIDECIDEGRKAGMLWSEFAEALEITPQGVSKRYYSRARVDDRISSDAAGN